MRTKASCDSGAKLPQTPIPILDIAQPTIAFRRLPLSEMNLAFPPRSLLAESRKRGRSAADIDGENSCLQKKKRRLRLFLITSRLSPQFSHPATNIANRGCSKIAVWAKQKALRRNLLRKAAILNRIRRGAVLARETMEGRGRLLVEQEKEQVQFEMARLAFNYGNIDTYTRPVHLQTQPIPPSTAVQNGAHFLVSGSLSTSRNQSPTPASTSPALFNPMGDKPSDYCSPNAAYALSPPRAQPLRRDYEPLLPSPLGLSNYDALDVEDDAVTDPYSHLDDDDDDNNDDPYYYLWGESRNESRDERRDERYDSPFSSSAITIGSHKTARTGMSQIVKTPQTAYVDSDVVGSLLCGFEETEEDMDSVWPSPCIEAALKVSAKPVYSGASPNFSALNVRPLAVQYPGQSISPPRSIGARAPDMLPDMAIPSMSPELLPTDLMAWSEHRRHKTTTAD